MVARGKIRLAAFDGLFPKTPTVSTVSGVNCLPRSSSQYLDGITTPLCVTFFTEVCRGYGQKQKRLYRRKNLADISYISRVIANFVPNFVAMATGVKRGKYKWHR